MTRKSSNKNASAKAAKKKVPEGGSMMTRSVGAYATPGSRNTMMRTQGPRMSMINNGRGICLSNTESLAQLNIINTGATSKGLVLNPAVAATFPWLARIAANYSLYRWKKLVISYCPVAPTTLGGSVELAVFYESKDYDAWLTAAAISGQNLSTQSQYAFGPVYAGGAIVSGSQGVSNPNFFGVLPDIDAAHRKVPWFNINSSTTVGSDSNTTIACYLATQTFGGTSTTQVAGTLFASYEIELIEPTSPNFN